jgi:hypothetical protein
MATQSTALAAFAYSASGMLTGIGDSGVQRWQNWSADFVTEKWRLDPCLAFSKTATNFG